MIGSRDRRRRGRRRAPGRDAARATSSREALAGLLARPARVALTVLGTVIGVGALVATLGLSKTAGNQIVGRFDALAATDIVVSPSAARRAAPAPRVLPWDAEARLQRLNGVAAAGTLADVDVRGALVRSVPINDPLAADRGPAAGEGRLARAVSGPCAPSSPPGASSTPATRARADRVAVLGHQRRPPPRHHARRPAARDLHRRPPLRR